MPPGVGGIALAGPSYTRKRQQPRTSNYGSRQTSGAPLTIASNPTGLDIIKRITANQPTLRLTTRAYGNRLGPGFADIDTHQIRTSVLEALRLPAATRASASVRVSKQGETAFYTVDIYCSAEEATMAREHLHGGFVSVKWSMGRHADGTPRMVTACLSEYVGTDPTSSLSLWGVTSMHSTSKPIAANKL